MTFLDWVSPQRIFWWIDLSTSWNATKASLWDRRGGGGTENDKIKKQKGEKNNIKKEYSQATLKMFLMIYCAINPWCTDSLIVIRSCNGKFSQPFNLTCWVSVKQVRLHYLFHAEYWTQWICWRVLPCLHENDLVKYLYAYSINILYAYAYSL